MNIIKRSWYILLTVAFASCISNKPADKPPNSILKPIVVKPLVFDNEEKINWMDIRMPEQPDVSKIDISSLPATPYSSSDFKPFSKPIKEARFVYDDLPSKDLDISKLPTKPLKFDTCVLGPPKSIVAGSLHLKNLNNASLFKMGEAQGVDGARVTCLLTDRDGFLWIATEQGVYHYDGQNLVQFIPGPIKHSIFSMLQDKSGQIWMGTQNGGLLVFEPETGLIKTLSSKQSLSHNNVARMLCDDQQRIWVTTLGGGVDIIDPQKQTIKILKQAQGLSAKEAVGITQDANHNIWIATYSNGVDVIDIKNNRIRYVNKTNGLNKDSSTMILADRQNRIWIAPYPGGQLTVIDIAKKTIRYIQDSQGANVAVWTLITDNKDHIWAGTSSKGVQVIDLDNKRIRSLHTTGDLNGDASGDFVENIIQDNRGQMWIATRNGLNVLKENPTLTERIGTSSAACLLEDHNGIIWEGTFGEGVKIVDRKKQMSRQLTTKQGLMDNTVQIIKEINGEIFICTNSGLDILSSNRKTIRHLSNIHTKERLSSSFITYEAERTVPNVIAGKTGKLWVSSNGLYIIDLKKRSARYMQVRPNDYVNDLLFDNQENVWISTVLNGIGVINTQTGTIKYLKSNPKLESGFKLLLKDDEGNIWIGTSKGIYIADVKNNKLALFSVQQGLIGEGVISLLKHGGHIYACTQNGITVIAPGMKNIIANKEWKVESFGMDYGLTKVNTDYYNTDLITKDGLYWWRDNGITLLNLAQRDTFSPRCYIAGISLLDEQKRFMDPERSNSGMLTRWGQNKTYYNKKDGTSADSAYLPGNNLSWQNVAGPYNVPVNLRLSYNQNFIQFQYTNLDLIKNGRGTYRYMLEGSDKKWSDVTASTSSKHYFSLKPGQYTFKVMTLGLHRIWSKPAQLSFNITPPWWQTWWAFLLYALLFSGVTWCFVYFRSLQLVKDKRILEHKVSIRTQEVLEQKEEIATQRDNLESQRNDIEKALSDLKTTQIQLIQKEKMASMGELTAGIAHEIQNPLNFVNNFSDVNTDMIEELEGQLKAGNIEEALIIAADMKENEQKINHHGKRADAIVKGMLQHSKTSSGTKEPTNINNLADDYLRLSYQGLRAKDKNFSAELVTQFDENLPKINVIPQDMGRVLLNLFNNAFYAVNQKSKTAAADYKPEVMVSTSYATGHIAITVKDNGVGIPDAIKEKIMQPFFTTKPTGEGTGLGLSLSYDILVKGHNGTLDFDSKEGEGSEFIIQLPANQS